MQKNGIRQAPTAKSPLRAEFLSRLRLSFTCGDFFFVDAGVDRKSDAAVDPGTSLLEV
ncbi:hypothetical protein [Bradyrhizobium genosp. P]|uniref:hypothetical protein n=1 Tax=Bradyrhizobium genosp. P TaxID=83641 RepID=UPI003CF5EAF2